MSTTAERLRAIALALRTTAEAHAAALEAVADELERGADEWITTDAAYRMLGMKSKRSLLDAGKRGDVPIVGPKGARVIRRRDLDAWVEAQHIAPARVATDVVTASASPREAARAAVAAREALADRIRTGVDPRPGGNRHSVAWSDDELAEAREAIARTAARVAKGGGQRR